MTKKQFQNFILETVGEYKNYLNLQDWDIGIVFMEYEHEEEPRTAMTNTVDESYLRSTIRVFPVSKEQSDDENKHTVMHELCHIITEPQYSLCRGNVHPQMHMLVEEQREQETERIARIAMKGV